MALKQIEPSKLKGNWTTTKIIQRLNFDVNYSNWIDLYESDGYLKFEVYKEKGQESFNAKLLVPYSEYGSDKIEYIRMYKGRMNIHENEIWIWQNEVSPAKFYFTFENNILSLLIRGKSIDFKKDNNNFFQMLLNKIF